MAVNPKTGELKSHFDVSPNLHERIEEIKSRLIKNGDTEFGPLSEKLDILQQLSEFEYGRYLIQHGGINGRWSHYLFYEFSLLKAKGNSFHPLEYKMLTSKGMESNRQRISLSQSLLAPDLKNGISILSVPCGVMAELLTLNLSALQDFRLVGVDLDRESIDLAKDFARKNNVADKTEFYQRDAWNLQFDNEFDRIVSLGLNMYCQDSDSAQGLYRSLHRTLKKDGKLLMSYLTPALPGPDCERDLQQMGPTELKLMPLISEILQVKYINHLNTSKQIVENLKMAGFKSVSCHYSSFRALNIAVAIK